MIWFPFTQNMKILKYLSTRDNKENYRVYFIMGSMPSKPVENRIKLKSTTYNIMLKILNLFIFFRLSESFEYHPQNSLFHVIKSKILNLFQIDRYSFYSTSLFFPSAPSLASNDRYWYFNLFSLKWSWVTSLVVE